MIHDIDASHLHFLSHEESKNSKKSLLISMGISILIFIVEIYGAYKSNSLSLLTDAFHIVTDILAHTISLIAVNVSLKNRTMKYTFGFLRVEIIAAFINAILLVLLCGFLLVETFERIMETHTIHANEMLAYSLIGLFLNSLSALVLFNVSKTSINLKSAYIHVLGDLLGTVSVVVGAILIRIFEVEWIDTFFSFFIIVIIGRATYGLIKDSIKSLMESSPDTHKLEHILSDIRANPKLSKILSFHHWSLTNGVECINLRLLLKEKSSWEVVITGTHKLLKEKYGITHVNIETATKESDALIKSLKINRSAIHLHGGHGHHHH
ncbi:MAG: cation transporter [Leptospira sp.]|nr:cation transporter [Leptospira sp.]NCS94346.1 cation transporter [Leptospira sp.]